jgi:23S rRNA (guanine1835-N2)-methyltransferase
MTENTLLSLEGYPDTILERYQTPDYLDLRAWDAADEHLLINALPHLKQGKLRILVINDRFASIASVMRDHQPTLYSDYATTALSLPIQLNNNGVQPCMTEEHSQTQPPQQAKENTPVNFVNDLSSLADQQFDLILLKIPKLKRYYHLLLANAGRLLADNGTLIVSGMLKHTFADAFDILSDYFRETDKYRHHKKSLMFSAKQSLETVPDLAKTSYKANGAQFESLANVYGAESPDLGGLFLLENLPKQLSGQLLDLGCGNGLLGICLKRRHPELAITFSDDSYMAVESAKNNWQTNIDEKDSATFRLDYGLQNYQGPKFEHIVCNPPFHQDYLVSEHIARQLIRDAARHINQGGKIYLVANSHLNYHQYLKRQRLQFERTASSKKFVVYTIQM